MRRFSKPASCVLSPSLFFPVSDDIDLLEIRKRRSSFARRGVTVRRSPRGVPFAAALLAFLPSLCKIFLGIFPHVTPRPVLPLSFFQVLLLHHVARFLLDLRCAAPDRPSSLTRSRGSGKRATSCAPLLSSQDRPLDGGGSAFPRRKPGSVSSCAHLLFFFSFIDEAETAF